MPGQPEFTPNPRRMPGTSPQSGVGGSEAHPNGPQVREAADSPAARSQQQQDAAILAGTLRAARAQGRDALVRHRRHEVDSWAAYLLPAARQLEKVLSSLLESPAVWSAIRSAEATTGLMSDALMDELTLVFDQDITGLLEFLGYSQPPPAEDWARDVVNALADVLSYPDAAMASRSARRAEQDLTLFVYRLRRCIEQAEQLSSPDDAAPTVRQRLVTTVEQAVVAAGPAVVAAAAVAYTFPPVGVAAGSLGLAALAGSKKALETGLTAATGSLLSRATANETEQALPQDLFEAAYSRVSGVARDLSIAIHQARDVSQSAELVRALAIEAVSATHALRAVLFQLKPTPGRPAVVDWIDDTVRALADLLESVAGEADWLEAGTVVETSLTGLVWALAPTI